MVTNFVFLFVLFFFLLLILSIEGSLKGILCSLKKLDDLNRKHNLVFYSNIFMEIMKHKNSDLIRALVMVHK